MMSCRERSGRISSGPFSFLSVVKESPIDVSGVSIGVLRVSILVSQLSIIVIQKPDEKGRRLHNSLFKAKDAFRSGEKH